MSNLLNNNYLPENPYNILERMLVHESIFENIRIFYQSNRKAIQEKTINNERDQ